MRRMIVVLMDDGSFDEREFQFDVRRLEAGDPVDVFGESERRWLRGTFRISTAGDAFVDLPRRDSIGFEDALRIGVRRVLH
jgi:hypothetical protein